MKERIITFFRNNGAVTVLTVIVVAMIAREYYKADVPAPDPMPISLPARIETQAGRQMTVEAKSQGQIVWVMPPGQKFDRTFFGNLAIVTCAADGEYWIGALTVLKGKASEVMWCRIVCSGSPAPNPDNPNPPPPPNDPFAAALAEAWKQEPAADKAKLPAYKEVFVTASRNMESDFITTVGGARQMILSLRKSKVGDSLRKLADVIGDRFDKNLPKVEDQPINQDVRARFVNELRSVSEAFDRLK